MADISQEQYEEYRSGLKQMRMLDDTLMKCVFKGNKPIVELVLRILLQRDDLEVVSFTVSKEYKNLRGHSVCLDVFAVDKDGKHYDIEVQCDDRGADPKRARFNSSMMDIEMLGKGQDYDALKESITIFITKNDVFKKGKVLYHFIRTEEESGEPLGDGSHIIYANASYVGDDAVGWLMSDLRETDPRKMHYDVLAARVYYLKCNPEGEKEMCEIMEKIVEKRAQKARQAGIQEGRLEGIQEGIQTGIQKGIQEGRLEGIQISIRLCRQFGLSNEQIIEQIASEYEISKKEAAKYVYAE